MDKLPKQSWETVEYTDNPELPELEDVEIVADFLPSPTERIFKEAERQETTIHVINRLRIWLSATAPSRRDD